MIEWIDCYLTILQMVKRKKKLSSSQNDPEAKRQLSEEPNKSEWTTDAGLIIKVKLTNFMCHQNFEYSPIDKLNFLSGANGSGKSAILTAIVFALGGSARASNRGNSNRNFIRTGQQRAEVEIHLLNEGDMAYKPDLYGKKIIIQRTVNASGGGMYKIKDQNGKIVVDRKVKEELDRILTAFMIQVDNPIAILNQDTAKSFLYKCDPSKLYDFFMRATQLEDLLQDQNQAREELNAAKAAYIAKEGHLQKLLEERKIWDKKLSVSAVSVQINEELERTECEIPYL